MFSSIGKQRCSRSAVFQDRSVSGSHCVRIALCQDRAVSGLRFQDHGVRCKWAQKYQVDGLFPTKFKNIYSNKKRFHLP